MKSFTVKELMVPIAEYATVSSDATLYAAVAALEKAQEEFDHTRYRHRAILILDADGHVVGKMSQLDVLRALEPKYSEMMEQSHLQQRLGFTKHFMKSVMLQYKMWDSPMGDICRKAAQQSVSKYMHKPTEGEHVDVDATLDEAIHQLVMGQHQSLLVVREKKIVGILRLTDVFAAVFHTMKACYQAHGPGAAGKAE